MQTYSTQSINVGILDDHPLVLDGLRKLLEDDGGFRVPLLACSGEELQAYLGDISQQRPDVMLLDIRMEGMNGYRCCQWLQQNHPDIRLMAMTAIAQPSAIVAMLASGARGFLLKSAPVHLLFEAIRTLMRCGHYVNELVTEHQLKLAEAGQLPSGLATLTERKLDFLKLACTAKTYAEIGERMYISPSTVNNYFEEAYSIFGVRTRAALVAACYKLGVIK